MKHDTGLVFTDLIRKKQSGHAFNSQEVKYWVQGAAKKNIPDYQLSALLMAIFFQGLETEECFKLTQEIKNSGRSFAWRELDSRLKDFQFSDKHSTGGVGDKVSLVLAPMAAAMGMKIPMMSGRSLGHTGGTCDKLESIPGFRLELSTEKCIQCLIETGFCMLTQTEEMCPVDKKFYALRDATSTVSQYGLIAASIVSKKWAEGIDHLIFDVKYGSGAFMKTKEEARELSRWLLKISQRAGLNSKSCITAMTNPLGSCVGNALEVKESLWILSNQYPNNQSKDIALPLKELCIDLCAEMSLSSGTHTCHEEAQEKALQTLESGHAYELFKKLAHLQGAEKSWEHSLASAPKTEILHSKKEGYCHSIDSFVFGRAGLDLGVGRKNQESKLNPSTGFEILVKAGDRVEKGSPLVKIHSSTEHEMHSSWLQELYAAFEISEEAPACSEKLMKEVLL